MPRFVPVALPAALAAATFAWFAAVQAREAAAPRNGGVGRCVVDRVHDNSDTAWLSVERVRTSAGLGAGPGGRSDRDGHSPPRFPRFISLYRRRIVKH